MSFLTALLESFWDISVEASPFLLFGFAVAAVLHAYLPTETLLKLLGGGRFRPTLTAAAVGIPLPLCSCSVVPTALAIREKGASPGATLAFFISTPETGVDSIAVTYGVMGPFGPILAVARPLAAGLSAVTAGLALDAFGPAGAAPAPSSETVDSGRSVEEGAGQSACCGEGDRESTAAVDDCCEEPDKAGENSQEGWAKAPAKLRRSFFMLFDEIAFLIALGLAVSALIAALLPEDLGLAARLGNPFLEMGLAILIGLPMYVCATASTPLAAVLIAKGLSPGAALVFLLVGPATNIGTIAIVRRMLGNAALGFYLTSIVLISVAFGLGVNWLCQDLTLDFSAKAHSHPEGVVGAISAVFLWFLLIWRAAVEYGKRRRQKT